MNLAFARLLAAAIDLLVAGAATAVLFVALTGGGVFTLLGVRVSLTTTGNPIAFGALLVIARALWLKRVPLLGISAIAPARFDAIGATLSRIVSRDGIPHERSRT
ncbi:MAG: hypothetical protein ACRD2A_22900, partial [Vicinamibacterales bacterium]